MLAQFYNTSTSHLPPSNLVGMLPIPTTPSYSSSWPLSHISSFKVQQNHVWHPDSEATHHVTSDPNNVKIL